MQENVFFLMINDDDEKYYYFAVKSKLDLYSSEWLRSKKEATTKGDHSFLPLKLGDFLFLKFLATLAPTLGFQIVSSVSLQKSMFSLLLDFFCLVNIHTCCNQ